ncbi:hypothetical protein [Dactylosporangium sp. NPDC005555]|uniref:hypothetical protein n=1 Tax=Dactylosporangium sp. NPDC005555 TaxID=3154889 RepID=UPI0033AC09BB
MSGAKREDDDNYEYYADVKLKAPGQCVQYEGWIFSGRDHAGVDTWYSSPFSWCN